MVVAQWLPGWYCVGVGSTRINMFLATLVEVIDVMFDIVFIRTYTAFPTRNNSLLLCFLFFSSPLCYYSIVVSRTACHDCLISFCERIIVVLFN